MYVRQRESDGACDMIMSILFRQLDASGLEVFVSLVDSADVHLQS
jgi:hypothetical protein